MYISIVWVFINGGEMKSGVWILYSRSLFFYVHAEELGDLEIMHSVKIRPNNLPTIKGMGEQP